MTRDEIINAFTYHQPRPGDKERYEAITARFLEMALFVYDNTPISREQSLALTHLQEARMMANAAIAIHGGEQPQADYNPADKFMWKAGDITFVDEKAQKSMRLCWTKRVVMIEAKYGDLYGNAYPVVGGRSEPPAPSCAAWWCDCGEGLRCYGYTDMPMRHQCYCGRKYVVDWAHGVNPRVTMR